MRHVSLLVPYLRRSGEEVDCDDAHATVHPDAEEHCDGLDNNCDGEVDDDDADVVPFYADADGDGYGEHGESVSACDAPSGYLLDDRDCDDTSDAAFPGHPEVCDGLDNDCNGTVDADAVDVVSWYADTDGDGYGEASLSVLSCDAAAGYSASADDCDDGDAAVHPTAPEPDCVDPGDYNCDGSVAFADADGDGVAAGEDCDDSDPARSPTHAEVCDEAGSDEDCNRLADDADDGATGTTTWIRDADGDTFGTGLAL